MAGINYARKERWQWSRPGTICSLLALEAAWDRQEPTSRGNTIRKAPIMESTMSEEPRGEGVPEESLHEAGAEPVPQEGEARREEQQERPAGAEEVSRVEAQPEAVEETNKEAAPPEGTEKPS
jgi:hypothetical protein